MRLASSAVLLAAVSLSAQPAPEDCLALGRDKVLETAVYEGRRYPFKQSGCKAQFDGDPERFSQLYDALLEMHAAGERIAPSSPSLVPS